MKNELQRCNLLWIILERVVTLLIRCYPPKVRFGFRVGQATFKPNITPQPIERQRMPLELTINNLQQIPVTLVPQDARGNPAPVEDGSVVWSKIDGDAEVVPNDTGMTGMLVSQDNPGVGDSNFMVSADADLGNGVETISDTVLLHVTTPHAANVGLQAGAPELKPQAKPEKK